MAKVLTIKMEVRYDLIMRTTSGVELFYNPETNPYLSEDMDAVMDAIKRDMRSNNLMDVIVATGLFEKMQKATLING